MRLNLDCVRDILFCVEENTGLRKSCFFIDSGLEQAAAFTDSVVETPDYEKQLFEKYDNDTLIYHVHYCIEADMLVKVTGSDLYCIVIADLTYQGHEFIAKIRDTQQWTAVKKGAAAVRNYSLSAISSIAEGITGAAISAYLSKNP